MNCVDYFFEHSKHLQKEFVVGREVIDYYTLFDRTMQLAAYIRTKVGNGRHILLLSANNPFFITAYLAILKSGNACVPLDPRIETENLQYVREQTNPVMVFLTPDVEKRLNLNTIPVITPAVLTEISEKKYEVLFDEEFDGNSVAEVIFTSGSTGTPKGVMLSHANLIANTSSILDYLKLTSNDRVLVVMPFFYCYGLSLLHTHLRIGGSVVLNNSFIFLGAVINDLKNNACTGFSGVPSHFQILLRKSESFKTTSFPELKYVTQAGGKLSTVFIDEFRETFPQVKFYVMYGQTEATARLSYLPPEEYSKRKGSLGRGIPGVNLKVVDEHGNAVKPGETGEIIAQGGNIMLGYLHDPDSTSEVIRNGWLHTGDLATIDEEGFIYHSARKKEIMKINGKRVSPKEIEEVILGLPDVVDCSIEAIDDDIQGEAIKAVVVVSNIDTTQINTDKIREHCSKKLALYKVPKFIELKERMELSSSGKKVKAKL